MKKRVRELYFTQKNPTSKIKPGNTIPVLIADIDNRKQRDLRTSGSEQKESVCTQLANCTKPA